MADEMTQAQKNKIAELLHDKEYTAMTVSELAFFMQVPAQDRPLFQSLIDALVSEGRAVLTRKGKVMAPDKLGLLRGTYLGTERGFGFVASEDAAEDVFIPAGAANGAQHKDIVLYRVVSSSFGGTRAEGEVVTVVTRGILTCVGTYEQMKHFGIVTPDERKLPREIVIPKGSGGGAVTGHKVVVRLTKAAEGDRALMGVVTAVIGHANDPGVDILSIALDLGIPTEFPKKTLKEAEAAPQEVCEKDLEGRADFRGLLTVTIDGDDAKDLDDAVSLEKLENGNVRLGVHIADVSHYVRAHSALDEEALRRGTSVYLVDRVIPMLPPALSNGICSLNPQCDRLTLSCMMELDARGDIAAHEIVPSVIRTARRLSYETVNELITGQNAHAEWGADICSMLDAMAALSGVLREKRIRRGAIEFNLSDCKILLDENGVPTDIRPYARNAATSLIEEFMLACNETVAEAFFWLELPFVYRTHEEPDPQKLEKLTDLVARFGYTLRGGPSGYTKSLQSLLAGIDTAPEEILISRMALRSMKQARYTPVCNGHFGLAAKYYCHFTSPIRRYPDLQIHRIIKAHLRGELDGRMISELAATLPEICIQCSATERRAETAERETDTLKKVEFMSKHIGEMFDGVISGVTSWGLYVELPNTAEGMVPIGELPGDDFTFDEELMRLYGRRSGKTYGLGEKVTVRLLRTDTLLRRIDFGLAE